MDRFSADFIRTVSYGIVGATILWYYVVAFWAARDLAGRNADEFLRYRSSGDTELPPLSAELLHASLMGSAFSLASSVYVYLNWAATDGALALWSPITWTLGAVVLFALRRQVFKESRGHWTLHGFLERKYGSPRLKKVASVVTSGVFLLQVVAEVYVGLSVLRVFFGPSVPLWLLCVSAGAVFVGYSVIGGLPAILLTDTLKYRLTALALLLVGIGLFDQGGASAIQRIGESLKTTFVPSSASSLLLVLSLAALNLPIFITDMSVWQRVGAARNEREVTGGLGRFALFLLPWLTLIVFIGIGFGPYLTPAAGWTTAQAVFAFFGDSLVFPFLLAGLFAALLTTADNYLIASVQTVLVDWSWSSRLNAIDFDPARLPAGEQRRMLRSARWLTGLLGIGAVLLGYLLLKSLPSLLDLLFVIFGLQAALAPAVFAGLVGKAEPADSTAGVVSILIGAVAASTCLFLAMAGKQVGGISLALVSPILVLLLSSASFVLLRVRARSSAAS